MSRQFSIFSFLLILCLPFLLRGRSESVTLNLTDSTGILHQAMPLECTIEVEVRRDSQDPTRKNPSYVDDLVVKLMLGVEVESESGKTFEFFRSEAALVSLKEGVTTYDFICRLRLWKGTGCGTKFIPFWFS